MLNARLLPIIVLLLATQCGEKKDCSPDLFTGENIKLVEDRSEWVDENGRLSAECDTVCQKTGSEPRECELISVRDPTDEDLEGLLWSRLRSGMGGFGGAGIFEDPAVLEVSCTYDESTSRFECNIE